MNRTLPRRVRGQASRSANIPSNPRNRASIFSTATGNLTRSARRLSSFRRCSALTAERRAEGTCLRCARREIFAPF